MSIIRFIFFTLLVSFLADGCLPKPSPDPLVGWQACLSKEDNVFEKAIEDDYRSYIRSLPAHERYYVQDYDIWFLKDGTGQHAVKINIPLNGVWRSHVLIYDKNNKRIKVIKYVSGYYRS